MFSTSFLQFLILSFGIMNTVAFHTIRFNHNPLVSTTQLNILPVESALEAIIANKALLASLVTNLRRELTLERVVIEFNSFCGPNSLFYISIILTYMYGEYRFFEGSHEKYSKLREFPVYQKTEKIIKEIIFIVLFVVFKDLHSAT